MLKPEFLIIGAGILFINALYSFFLYKIDYASDEEWFRYLVIYTFCCCGLIIFNLFVYMDFFQILRILMDNKNNLFNEVTDQCTLTFKVNITFKGLNMVLISLISAFQLYNIGDVGSYLFLKHDCDKNAISYDPDVIVQS